MKTSVAVCTYNGEKFLQKQIDSILNQTHPIDEIIVCDDGSTDATLKILNSYKEKYPEIFQIYINEKNLRSVKNFEKAISLCTHEIIFLSDQDDIWVENKVEKYLNYFETHPETEVIASNGFGIDENGKKIDAYSFWDIPKISKEVRENYKIKETLLKVTNIATGASLSVKKSFLKDVIPFPDHKILHHDEWIAFAASLLDKFEFLPEKLFYYRIHSHQQIGGVFFEKNEKSILFLKRTFGLIQDFKGLSKYIRRLCEIYYRNYLYLELQPHHHQLIEKNMNEIETLYKEKVDLVKRKFPIRSKFLFLTDVKNKRKLISRSYKVQQSN
ncbi:glycosyltransferase family 2 protein [uncultured Chryseobacterium sp.]|uniref:glycosyltransferase family 2 protein n=1 Tax=uncultured Chryseobacterium sp. TaxID=259322 RepID=UPI0027DB619E|nr:glycosyltransferase family 2 protein [uncultured Chryseobacterium sp.]